MFPNAPGAKKKYPLNAKSLRSRIAMVSARVQTESLPSSKPDDGGGHGKGVSELSKRLVQLGYEVDVWAGQSENGLEIGTLSPHVRLIRLPGAVGLPEWNLQARQLMEQSGLKYKFINSHHWHGYLAGHQLSGVFGLLHVHTPDTLSFWRKRPADGPRGLNGVPRPLQREIFLPDFGSSGEKRLIVPPGYDENRFFPVDDIVREAIRRRLGFTGPVIHGLGRLTEDGACARILQAFATVAQQLPDAELHLAVAGKSLTPEEVRAFIGLRALVTQLGLSKRVQLRGGVSADQFIDYCRAAELTVFCSESACFDQAAVEAMACGSPTLLIVPGGLYRALGFKEPGLHADLRNPKKLGLMMLKILRQPRLRADLSNLGAREVRRLFSWGSVAKQFSVLAERTGS